jgi:hypothetical protein
VYWLPVEVTGASFAVFLIENFSLSLSVSLSSLQLPQQNPQTALNPKTHCQTKHYELKVAKRVRGKDCISNETVGSVHTEKQEHFLQENLATPPGVEALFEILFL